MSGEQLATLLLAVFAGAGASLVTGLLSRPKVTAEASAAHAGTPAASERPAAPAVHDSMKLRRSMEAP